jgi:spermidine/putrescine transport system ATP-binding protein
MPAGVELEHVTKTFGDVKALDDVSITVEKAEFMSVLGPSGCGKTTMLRIIAGLAEPDLGSVRIQGQLVDGIPSYRRNVGLVFQSYALFPHMKVYDNIAFPLRIRRLSESEIRNRVMRTLEIVRLAGHEDRYPRQLSGGEQQRVALARALVFEPAVLLLDEPLGSLDLKLRVQMRYELRQIQKTLKVTTIFVTHDQEEALSMSDRVSVMNKGRIEQIGTPYEVYEKPSTVFVASFVGASNLFEGKVLETSDSKSKIDFAGHHVYVQTAAHLQEGKTIKFVVRPERIRLLTKPEETQDNVLRGKIINSTYLGQYFIYDVELENGITMKVTVSQPDNVLLRSQDRPIYVAWKPEATIVLST